jgi:hypothetical protein
VSERISDRIEAIADTIETFGHLRGAYGNPETGFCILGAAMYNRAYLDSVPPEIYPICEYIEEHKQCSVMTFSDGNETQEVLDTLRAIAKEQRIKEEAHGSQDTRVAPQP